MALWVRVWAPALFSILVQSVAGGRDSRHGYPLVEDFAAHQQHGSDGNLAALRQRNGGTSLLTELHVHHRIGTRPVVTADEMNFKALQKQAEHIDVNALKKKAEENAHECVAPELAQFQMTPACGQPAALGEMPDFKKMCAGPCISKLKHDLHRMGWCLSKKQIGESTDAQRRQFRTVYANMANMYDVYCERNHRGNYCGSVYFNMMRIYTYSIEPTPRICGALHRAGCCFGASMHSLEAVYGTQAGNHFRAAATLCGIEGEVQAKCKPSPPTAG